MRNMETKQKIRALLKQRRESLSEEQALGLSRKTCEKIAAHPWFLAAEKVYFYHPLGKEVNLLPLAEQALTLGKKTAFPRTAGKSMEFYQVFSLADFKEGSFHVMEPEGNTLMTEEMPLVLVPGLGFDLQGGRLGYGGGYYDRYFSRYPRCRRLGTAYSIQIVEHLVREPHDIPMDGIATEQGIYLP